MLFCTTTNMVCVWKHLVWEFLVWAFSALGRRLSAVLGRGLMHGCKNVSGCRQPCPPLLTQCVRLNYCQAGTGCCAPKRERGWNYRSRNPGELKCVSFTATLTKYSFHFVTTFLCLYIFFALSCSQGKVYRSDCAGSQRWSMTIWLWEAPQWWKIDFWIHVSWLAPVVSHLWRAANASVMHISLQLAPD